MDREQIPPKAKSARLILSASKRDRFGVFRAYFDELFFGWAEKPLTTDSGKRLRDAPKDFSQTASTPERAAPPHLSIAVIDNDGRDRGSSGVFEFSNFDIIRLDVRLEVPLNLDEEAYSVEELTVAATNNESNWGKAPSVEVVVYRMEDRERKPVPIRISTGGGGVSSPTHHVSVDLQILESRETRQKGIARLAECLTELVAKSAGPVSPAVPPPKPAAPSSEVISSPETETPRAENTEFWFGEMYVNAPAGNYEVIARYLAQEAGYWHSELISEPVFLKIVNKGDPCDKLRGAIPN